MRKYLIAISTYAFATVLLADVNDINNLKNANVNIADAARMSLEKSLDQDTSERALYENLLTQKDLRLANGIIYSLGKMKSSIAKAIIMEFAKTSSDKYPASIFALAEYNDRDSITILEKLSKSNQNARAALNMTKKSITFCKFS